VTWSFFEILSACLRIGKVPAFTPLGAGPLYGSFCATFLSISAGMNAVSETPASFCKAVIRSIGCGLESFRANACRISSASPVSLASARAEAAQKRTSRLEEERYGRSARRMLASSEALTGAGKYAEAEPLCRRSLAIREKVLGPKHPHLATSLKNYAILLQKMGRNSEAEEMLARVRAIRES
jgi:hypothetical protein